MLETGSLINDDKFSAITFAASFPDGNINP